MATTASARSETPVSIPVREILPWATIGLRTALYFTMLAMSVIAAKAKRRHQTPGGLPIVSVLGIASCWELPSM